jgi:hypothetical protein
MTETDKVKRNVKKLIADMQKRIRDGPKKDRLDQFFDVGVSLGNVIHLSQIMGRYVDVPWAADQNSKTLLMFNKRIAESYISLAEAYLEFLDSIKGKIVEQPEISKPPPLQVT